MKVKNPANTSLNFKHEFNQVQLIEKLKHGFKEVAT